MATQYTNTSADHRLARGEHYRLVLGHPAASFTHPLSSVWGDVLDWVDSSQWVVPLNRTAPSVGATTAALDVVVYQPGEGHTVGELVNAIIAAGSGALSAFGLTVYVYVLSVTYLSGSQIASTGLTQGGDSRQQAADDAAGQLATSDPLTSAIGAASHVLVAVLVAVAVLAVLVGAKGLREWV